MAYLHIAIVRMRRSSVSTTTAVSKNKAKLSVERNSPTPHSGRMDNLRSSQSKPAWLDRSCGKNNMLLEEICYRRRYVAGKDMFPEGICCWGRYVAGGDMLPEEICCCGRYVAGGNMLPEEICCRRRYVAGGDMLPEEICFWMRYVAG